MTNLDLLHFEQLKSEIQAQYLKNHTPSDENISNWKGIDIIYFQEDLRKIAKGNISEKSFYTYFKTTPITKLPRIDILNLLSSYVGFASWYDFKKNHLFANEILQTSEEYEDDTEDLEENTIENVNDGVSLDKKEAEIESKNLILQKSIIDNQIDNKNNTKTKSTTKDVEKKSISHYIWLGVTAVLALAAGVLGFKDDLFSKEYRYSFIDADRNTKINAELQIKILKENESPLYQNVKPNEQFVYKTKSKKLTMVISSPYYKTDTIYRNLENAPETESIELKPDDYAIMLYYYSNSIQDIKKKRQSLNYLISDNALIYQVYANDKYGVETLDKTKYINMVTTPTTSLKNMEIIDTQKNNGKITLIKFRIKTEEIDENLQ